MKPFALTIALIALCGCSPESKSPEAIRRDAASLTTTVARDTRAAAAGVVDGLKNVRGPVNINTASGADLTKLPGVDEKIANRIIASRPYATSSELLERKIVSRAEYDRIVPLIEAR